MKTLIKITTATAAAAMLAAAIGCADHATRDNAGYGATDQSTTSSDQSVAATGTSDQSSSATGATSTNGAVVDDVTLTNNVQATLANTPGVKANQITVQSSDGVVTLRGDVDSQDAANAAVQAAQGVNGVSSVQNQLNVSGSQPPR
ncbi:MAG TPA: BON domain-containing protein [Gammaproteobacteria bacterium]|jgi:osmotically-inducible protein OsmY|nr:BON domain-containing protein [Gammaproteobacteria bacterium]